MAVVKQIQAPRGVRFECSGCGNCCLQWPVPLTRDDYERISSNSQTAAAKTRPLHTDRENLLGFSHTLEKKLDGKCEFLTDINRCKLHSEYGEESKPSMCRLFPYSFTVTPDSVLASLSFASTAVLLNSGNLLEEQPEVLEAQYQLFSKLFKPKSELWLNLQLLDGHPLSWEKFKSIDLSILAIVESDLESRQSVPQHLMQKLQKSSAIIIQNLGDPSIAEKEPKLESRPKIIDQILLKHLEALLFPKEVFKHDVYDLNARAMMSEMVSAPQTVSFGQVGEQLKFSEIIRVKLFQLPQDIEELINRFLYVRLFAKQYFGPGFHHLSLLAGIHFLRTLNVLLRLKIKQSLLLNANHHLDFELAAELVRTCERRLTQLNLSPQSLAMLEVLLSSIQRQDRICFLAE